MSEIPFGMLDLNLLRIFDMLIEQRSVTRAGEKLGLTPSAVSHSISRLRAILGDELFIRTSHGVRPSPYAVAVGPRLREALQMLQQALVRTSFDPATTRRQFEISATPYICSVLLPGLIRQFETLAPGATLRVAPSRSSVFEDLQSGRTDLAISAAGRRSDHFMPEELDRLEIEELLRDSLVWVVRRDHPLTQEAPFTLKMLAAIPEVAVGLVEAGDSSAQRADRSATPTDLGAGRRALKAIGLEQKVGLIVPDMTTAVAVASQSNMGALMPKRVAVAMADSYGVQLFDPPYPCPHIEYHMRGRRDVDPDPGVIWLRQILRDIAGQL